MIDYEDTASLSKANCILPSARSKTQKDILYDSMYMNDILEKTK